MQCCDYFGNKDDTEIASRECYSSGGRHGQILSCRKVEREGKKRNKHEKQKVKYSLEQSHILEVEGEESLNEEEWPAVSNSAEWQVPTATCLDAKYLVALCVFVTSFS